MSAGSICVPSVLVASPDESIRAVTRRLARADVGTVVILGEAKRLVGIFTDRDVALRCVAEKHDPDSTGGDDRARARSPGGRPIELTGSPPGAWQLNRRVVSATCRSGATRTWHKREASRSTTSKGQARRGASAMRRSSAS